MSVSNGGEFEDVFRDVAPCSLRELDSGANSSEKHIGERLYDLNFSGRKCFWPGHSTFAI
jgi:hypothetical protein